MCPSYDSRRTGSGRESSKTSGRSGSDRRRDYSPERSRHHGSHRYSHSRDSHTPRDSRESDRRSQRRKSDREKEEQSSRIPELKLEKSEKGDEVSCSIEETNRVRALLGLKPLEIEKKKETPISSISDKQEEEINSKENTSSEQDNKDEELRQKLLRARQEREKQKAALPVKSLGDILEEKEGDINIEEWLSNSKPIQEMALKRMEEEKQKEKEGEGKEMKVESNFENVHVDHNLEDLEEGETVLVLQDSSILDKNGNLIDDDTVVLESTKLKEEEEARRNIERRKKSKLPVYDALDESNFLHSDDEDDHLLSQYNEEKKAKGFNLTAEGSITEESRAAAVSQNPVTHTVDVSDNVIESEQRVAQDYYTHEEVTQFKKRVKRKRHIRKTDNEIAPLAEHLEKDEDKGNRESREEALGLAGKLQEEQNERNESYKRATQREEERVKRLRRPDVDEENDTDLPLLLNRALHVEEKQSKSLALTEEEIARRASQLREEDEKLKAREEELGTTPDPNIITTIGEFSTQMKIQTADRKEEVRQQRKAEKRKRLELERQGEKSEESGDEKPQTNELMETNQPLAGSSVSAALQLMRSKGNVQEKELVYGRRDRQQRTRDNNDDGFILEYRDEDGHLLSRKEAYKQLSYRFHGKKQSKSRIEKKENNYKRAIASN